MPYNFNLSNNFHNYSEIETFENQSNKLKLPDIDRSTIEGFTYEQTASYGKDDFTNVLAEKLTNKLHEPETQELYNKTKKTIQDYLIWLDADVLMHDYITMEWLAELFPEDYIVERPNYSQLIRKSR